MFLLDYDRYGGPKSRGLSLKAPSPRTDLALQSFNYRFCSVWNSLLAKTV